jgi:hypothetical protein
VLDAVEKVQARIEELRQANDARSACRTAHAACGNVTHRHQYGVPSEYAHPNWAGTVLLYSDTDKQTAITDFGQYMRNAVPTKVIGVGNLSAALRMFQSRHNWISDLLPSFIGLCEAYVTNPQKPD